MYPTDHDPIQDQSLEGRTMQLDILRSRLAQAATNHLVILDADITGELKEDSRRDVWAAEQALLAANPAEREFDPSEDHPRP